MSAAGASGARRRADGVWLVLPDMLSTRVLTGTGILDGLRDALGERLEIVSFLTAAENALWPAQLADAVPVGEVMPAAVSRPEAVVRRADDWLEQRLGFFPLALRLNYRHGFHLERMEPGHANRFLDSDRVGPLPRWDVVDRGMARWNFSAHRYVPSELRRRLEERCGGLVLSNIQISGAGRFLTAARRLRIPTVGYVASWDHPVGKGVMSPHLQRYVVQNEIMRRDLARFHGIDDERVVITGWPQSDVFHRPRARAAFEALLARSGLDGARPVVLVTGNSPTNAPYEGRFVERLVRWWEAEARERVTLLFRPHPRDTIWEERYASALATPRVSVQPASYTDMDDLATLLQHVAVVVTNAGTILLDALVNDRPAVCVTYDEGAPPGEEWAAKNILGEHYRELMASGAFPLAPDFETVVAEIEGALADPSARRQERARVAEEVLGTVDGCASQRVVDAILEVVA